MWTIAIIIVNHEGPSGASVSLPLGFCERSMNRYHHVNHSHHYSEPWKHHEYQLLSILKLDHNHWCNLFELQESAKMFFSDSKWWSFLTMLMIIVIIDWSWLSLGGLMGKSTGYTMDLTWFLPSNMDVSMCFLQVFPSTNTWSAGPPRSPLTLSPCLLLCPNPASKWMECMSWTRYNDDIMYRMSLGWSEYFRFFKSVLDVCSFQGVARMSDWHGLVTSDFKVKWMLMIWTLKLAHWCYHKRSFGRSAYLPGWCSSAFPDDPARRQASGSGWLTQHWPWHFLIQDSFSEIGGK